MTAATSDRDSQHREAVNFAYPAKGGKVFYVGAMVAVDNGTGFAAPATGAGTEMIVGVCQKRLDTTSLADGAATVAVRRGCFRVINDPAFPYTLKDVGTSARVLDDSTCSKAANADAIGPIVRDVDARGVWIEI
ncbi:hypothetical protein AB3X91_03570 [Paraburkholderia sp. BR14263]|uniref:hypothetical protein n=1 Tax=unclassified Paraburkholderia TaxID=2615204 RepID=UPI0034CF6E5E